RGDVAKNPAVVAHPAAGEGDVSQWAHGDPVGANDVSPRPKQGDVRVRGRVPTHQDVIVGGGLSPNDDAGVERVETVQVIHARHVMPHGDASGIHHLHEVVGRGSWKRVENGPAQINAGGGPDQG